VRSQDKIGYLHRLAHIASPTVDGHAARVAYSFHCACLTASTNRLRLPTEVRTTTIRAPRRGVGRALAIALTATMIMLALGVDPAWAADTHVDELPQPEGAGWWRWPLALFVVCFFLGVIAVPAGVGGGVLFVPLVSGFFPFHLDFVRGTGLLVALSSALAAGPSLLRSGLASMRIAVPLALIASISSMAGALLGLALPASVVRIALGITILGIVAVMLKAGRTEFPQVTLTDRLGATLAMHGVFLDAASGREVQWRTRRTPVGLALFLLIGVLAGMFGLGAGWANVPALNIVMGAPLKVAAGSSSFILSLVDSSAAWVYLNNGAVLPVIAAPSIVGMMLGAKIGARLLTVLKASLIRKLVIGMLLFAGGRALMVGLGIGT
jgi:uncharacterized membrane protein YfcA